MKVYSCPAEVPEPAVDYSNFNLQKMQADEAAHMAKLKAWLIAQGYKGKNTGKEFSSPIADGHARYMFADGGAKSCLIHLPYGDGYNDPNVQYIPKTEILRRIAASDNLHKLFAKAK